MVSGAALVAASVSGCASAFRPSNRLVPGPSGAVGAAPLGQHRIAILSGSATAKGVFIVDLTNGEVQKSFGVTKESTGIAAETPEGPLLLTVGGLSPTKHPFGAVERWTLAGEKTQVVPLPSAARGISSVAQGFAYLLIGNGSARAALPIAIPSLKRGKPIALDANARTLGQCIFGDSPYLVYSGGTQGTVVVREIESGIVVRSTVVADAPMCLAGKQQVFAISHAFAAASIVSLSLPTLLQLQLIPASNDAIALYESADHHLLALNATSRLSNVEVFPDDALTKTGAK
jgi:hypothetical protein